MKEKNKKIALVAAIVFGLLMVLSPFAAMFYGFNDQTSKRSFGKYRFTRQSYGYEANINGKTENFIYFPGDIESINVSSEALSLIKGKQYMIMTSDPADPLNQSIAYMEYNSDKVLKDLNKTKMGFAYVNETATRTKITCENASAGMPVIYVRKANESAIRAEGNCLFIEARQQDEILADFERVFYIMIGVMEK